jgi:hypothetical protein
MRKEDGKIRWYFRPISVVLLLFFVLGPFALPLLYKSPKFSKRLKIILTIVVIIWARFLVHQENKTEYHSLLFVGKPRRYEDV